MAKLGPVIQSVRVVVISSRGSIDLAFNPAGHVATVRRDGEEVGLLHGAGYTPRALSRGKALDRVEEMRVLAVADSIWSCIGRLA